MQWFFYSYFKVNVQESKNKGHPHRKHKTHFAAAMEIRNKRCKLSKIAHLCKKYISGNRRPKVAVFPLLQNAKQERIKAAKGAMHPTYTPRRDETPLEVAPSAQEVFHQETTTNLLADKWSSFLCRYGLLFSGWVFPTQKPGRLGRVSSALPMKALKRVVERRGEKKRGCDRNCEHKQNY